MDIRIRNILIRLGISSSLISLFIVFTSNMSNGSGEIANTKMLSEIDSTHFSLEIQDVTDFTKYFLILRGDSVFLDFYSDKMGSVGCHNLFYNRENIENTLNQLELACSKKIDEQPELRSLYPDMTARIKINNNECFLEEDNYWIAHFELSFGIIMTDCLKSAQFRK